MQFNSMQFAAQGIGQNLSFRMQVDWLYERFKFMERLLKPVQIRLTQEARDEDAQGGIK
jgi:hypothetical protein